VYYSSNPCLVDAATEIDRTLKVYKIISVHIVVLNIENLCILMVTIAAKFAPYDL